MNVFYNFPPKKIVSPLKPKEETHKAGQTLPLRGSKATFSPLTPLAKEAKSDDFWGSSVLLFGFVWGQKCWFEAPVETGKPHKRQRHAPHPSCASGAPAACAHTYAHAVRSSFQNKSHLFSIKFDLPNLKVLNIGNKMVFKSRIISAGIKEESK